MTMTLNEAILHCEEKANELELKSGFDTDYESYKMSDEERHSCLECANEHKQLAAWLKELSAWQNIPNRLMQKYKSLKDVMYIEDACYIVKKIMDDINDYIKNVKNDYITTMTLDEAILHCEEEVDELELQGDFDTANEHKQLAAWLKELSAWQNIPDKLLLKYRIYEGVNYETNADEIIEEIMNDINDYIKRAKNNQITSPRLEKAKEIIKENYDNATYGIFKTSSNINNDKLSTIYSGDDFKIEICYKEKYFNVVGLTDWEFLELNDYYELLDDIDIDCIDYYDRDDDER